MRRNYGIVALIMAFWFVISFITNILGPLIPDMIDSFSLSNLALAGFIPSSFFIAYAAMSIPAGIMIERLSEKTVLLMGFSMPLLGSLLFVFAPRYEVLLVSSFIIGLGMAMLQTVINPLKRVAGGEENFAFFSVLGQLIFGAASFVSPFVYSYLVNNLSEGHTQGVLLSFLSSVTPVGIPWVSLYWVFVVILMVIILTVSLVRFPRITLKAEERSGTLASYKALLKNKFVLLFFFGIFAYVSTEQGLANWISKFLETYHGINPHVEGAAVVGRFWGAMSLGCLLGLVILRLFDSKHVLKVTAVGAICMLLVALFGSARWAVFAFPSIAFFASVMFSIIMSLGLNSVDSHHGSFAGILCSGIAGGAVGPLVVGILADCIGLRMAMLVVIIPLLYILSIGFWAQPLIRNKTIKLGKKQPH